MQYIIRHLHDCSVASTCHYDPHVFNEDGTNKQISQKQNHCTRLLICIDHDNGFVYIYIYTHTCKQRKLVRVDFFQHLLLLLLQIDLFRIKRKKNLASGFDIVSQDFACRHVCVRQQAMLCAVILPFVNLPEQKITESMNDSILLLTVDWFVAIIIIILIHSEVFLFGKRKNVIIAQIICNQTA